MSENTKNKGFIKDGATTTTKPYNKGFWKGYGQVQQKDVNKIRSRLFAALDLSLTSPVQFGHYLNGRIEPKASQAAKIEAVFASVGITEVWGGKE